MGYTWELRVTALDEVLDELRHPTLRPDALSELDALNLGAEAIGRWDELARTVAQAIGSGGGELTWPLSGYVHAVLRHRSRWYGAVGHSSSGGDDFRTGFLAGTAATTLGPELVGALANRPIAGLSTDGYPMFGWASNAELRSAVAAGLTVPDDLEDDPATADDVESLWTVVDVIERAAATGQDLVTLYA
ncbi:hypothetical protein [Cellulomonas sp. URHB0016]